MWRCLGDATFSTSKFIAGKTGETCFFCCGFPTHHFKSFAQVLPKFSTVLFLFEKRFGAVEKWLELIPKSDSQGGRACAEHRGSAASATTGMDVGWVGKLLNYALFKWHYIMNNYCIQKNISRQPVHLHLIPGVFFLWEMTLHSSQLISQQKKVAGQVASGTVQMGGGQAAQRCREKNPCRQEESGKHVKKDCLVSQSSRHWWVNHLVSCYT